MKMKIQQEVDAKDTCYVYVDTFILRRHKEVKI